MLPVLFLLMGLAAFASGQASVEELHRLVIPVQSERLRAHFRIPADMPLPATPDRVTNITRAQFREYALRGQPVIVTDGMRDWPGLAKWNCAYFHNAFPHEDVGGFTAYKADALKWRRKLGDPWFLTARETLGIPEEEADAKNPTVMSWYFSALGVDGTRGHDVRRNQTVVDTIKADFGTPYFLEPTKLNNDTVAGRLEFFFGTDGAGVHPHTDPVCQWIFSGQTSGRKSWRLSLPYNIDVLQRANPWYTFRPSDGNTLLAIMMNKAPLYEFTLEPGELMFFPPGMIHTTRAVGPECSTSLSLQFAAPNPVMYIKEFSADLVSDVIGASKCYLDHFNAWLFGDRMPAVDADSATLRSFCDAKFAEMDKDASEAISRPEALLFFAGLHSDGSSAGGLIIDDSELDADSFLQAHDTNNDGLVSKSEFDAVVFALWTPRMAQVALAVNKPQAVSYFFRADADSDDYITEAEMKAVYPETVWSHVMRYDDDGDGKLFQGEFHKHTRALYELMTGRSYSIDNLDEDDDDDNDDIKSDQKALQGDVTGSATEDEPVLPLADDPPPPAAGLKGIKIGMPLEEEVRQLWNIPKAVGELPVSPETVAQLSQETFRALAVNGQPLIVADGVRALVANLSCDSFKANFPAEPVKMCRGCKWKVAGETSSSEPGVYWEHQGLGQNTVIGGEEHVRTTEEEQRMQALTEIPYFVPRSEANTLLHHDHLHFFFGTNGGTGGPFSDMNCFWSAFGQVHGTSHWKLTIPYSVRQLQSDNADYVYFPPDGTVLVKRMIAEHPVYEFTLLAGQMLVLPPGLLKHFVMTGSECSVMFRVAFMDPAPVRYLQLLHEPLMSDSDGAAGCYTDHYNRWLMGAALPTSDGTSAGNARFVDETFRQMDSNADALIGLDEAMSHFPGKAEWGAIRTTELDGASFIAANDANKDGSVTIEELAATATQLWNPVMREVGGMWFFVDQRNAQEGGNWADYGRYVDSIRFRYGRDFTLDADGKAQESLAVGLLPERFPEGWKRGQVVPADFPWVVERRMSAGEPVVLARQRDDAAPLLGFVFWPKLSKSFVGPMQGGRRRGVGVFCCTGEDVFDQEWREGDDDGTSFLFEPQQQLPVKERCDAEVVNDVPGLTWMGSVRLMGPVAIRWTGTGDVFVGTFADGRRVGPGVLSPGDGTAPELVVWQPGQDKTDWRVLLDM